MSSCFAQRARAPRCSLSRSASQAARCYHGGMNHFRFVAPAFAFAFLLPSIAFAATDKASQLAELQALLAKLQAASSVATAPSAPTTWEFFIEANGIPVGNATQAEESFDEDDLFQVYGVYGGKIADTSNLKAPVDKDDQFIWDLFKAIGGEAFAKKHMRLYASYKGSDQPVLAYVQLINYRSPEWGMAVNSNASDIESRRWKRDIAITLVHEYGHVLFLNKTQVDRDKQNLKKCTKEEGRYLSYSYGCTKKKSYAQAYYNQYWTDREMAEAVDASEVQGETQDYYDEHPGAFRTEYAATNHIEDMAESFTDFVLRAKPTGNLEKDQKTRFFYDYPELVKERDRIRAVIGQYFSGV